MAEMYGSIPLGESSGKYLATYYGEILLVYNKGIINMQRLEAILHQPNYKSMYRLFLLNPDESIDYEIPQEDIIINSGNFSENYQSGQRKNVNISLVNADGKYTPNLNTIWVQNRFRFDIGIEYQGEQYWFPRGIYVLGNPSATHQDSDRQVSLTLVDKFAILEGKTGTLEATYEIPAGTDIETAIRGILTLDNGSGYPIDLKDIVYDSSFKGRKMPYTLSKDAGSTLADLILDIGVILNAEVYYNSEGHLCFVNINDTTNDYNKPTLWYYSEDEFSYLNSTLSFDFENAINEVHVVGDNVENAIFSAYSKNENPISPICIQNIGRRIEYINDSNIYSDQLAQERADYELRRRSILETTITIEVAFNPLLFVNNFISIEDKFFNLKRDEYIIQSISYNIGHDDKMTLTCSSITNFDFKEV